MLIAVTGASGRTGSPVVTALLAAGHTVRAVVRSQEKGAPLAEQGAEVVLSDLTTADAADWLTGCDGLVHTAAASDPTPGASDAVDRDATLALVAAAERAGVRRVVQVSSMYADRPDEGPEFLRDVLRAKAVSDAALAGSDLVWTIVRPGGLLDDDATGQVTVARQLGSGRISRTDVAGSAWPASTSRPPSGSPSTSPPARPPSPTHWRASPAEGRPEQPARRCGATSRPVQSNT